MKVSNESKVKAFSTKVLARFDVAALQKGLISNELLGKIHGIKQIGVKYQYKSGRTAQNYEDAASLTHDLTDDEKKQYADYLAIRSIIQIGLQGFEEALILPTPKERMIDYYKVMLEKCASKGMDKPSTMKMLAETCKDLRITLTTTVHPTVGKTYDAIVFQRTLTHEMEQVAGYLRQTNRISVTEVTYDLVDELIGDFIDDVNTGTPIAHLERVTVEEESKIEAENSKIISMRQKEVLLAHDAALEEIEEFTSQDIEDLRFGTSNPFENRTWVYADADGREKTDSISSMKAIKASLRDNKKLDLRQNSEIFANLIGGLVQVNYKADSIKLKRAMDEAARTGIPHQLTSENNFALWCQKFVEELNTKENVEGWKDSRKSIYQELGNHKSEFLRRLIKSNFHLIPEEIIAHAVPFTTKYLELFDSFVEEARLFNSDIPANVNFTRLKNFSDPHGIYTDLQLKFMQLVKDTPINFKLHGKETSWKFRVGEKGHHYVQDGYHGLPMFFQGVKKIDPKDPTNKIELSNNERDVMMDQLRKFNIFSWSIKEHGSKVVADRCEIANFEGAEDFYALMLLLKQSGIIKIENGIVTEVNMEIVPLLETEKDLNNAEKIYSELLNDPLALSYFKLVGKVLVMNGFSDGAKSAGNFASEADAIPESKRRIVAMFAKHGIKVEFKDGRGSTTERGGMPEAGTSRAENPDEVNIDPVEHRTIQSDQPLAWANSPARGADQMASLMIGTLAGSISAKTRTPEEAEMMAACNEAMHFIARVSAHPFREIIRDNHDTVIFLNGVAYNSDGSSRDAARAADTTSKNGLASIRAVPVSQKSNLAGIPFNNTGLKEALEIFMSGHTVKIVEEGHEVKLSSRAILDSLMKYSYSAESTGGVQNLPYPPRIRELIAKGEGYTSGELALETLKKHPKFEVFMRKTETSLQMNFDEHKARAYGKKTGCEVFVEKIIDSLEGLTIICQKALRRMPNYSGHSIANMSPIQMDKSITRFMADLLVYTLPVKLRMDVPAQKVKAHALRTALISATDNDMVPNPSARQRDVTAIVR